MCQLKAKIFRFALDDEPMSIVEFQTAGGLQSLMEKYGAVAFELMDDDEEIDDGTEVKHAM